MESAEIKSGDTLSHYRWFDLQMQVQVHVKVIDLNSYNSLKNYSKQRVIRGS